MLGQDLIHGEEEAEKAKLGAKALFGVSDDMSSVPAIDVSKDIYGKTITDLLVSEGVLPSKGEAKRLITQGGLSINDKKVTDFAYNISEADFKEGQMIIKRGKKKYDRFRIV